MQGALILFALLVTILGYWASSERSLSVENIKTFGAELLYWVAFVLTRPLGATFGDYLTKPVLKGGINLGAAGSSLVLILLLVATVVYSNWLEKRGLRKMTLSRVQMCRGCPHNASWGLRNGRPIGLTACESLV